MESEPTPPTCQARVLVVIASFGTANDRYLSRVINEYKSMPFKTKIVVLSNLEKISDPEIELKVGLPDKNPWSLPFGHKRVFADYIDEYDLFIYSEDDILIGERNIRAFAAISSRLEPHEIAGFLRVENDNANRKYFCDVHDFFHWDPSSVVTRGNYALAYFSNEHAACYILTNEQLKRAVNSGGFLVGPHQWKYDLLCTAATDVYTQCGWIKLIPISHLSEFCVEHLSHKYIGKLSLSYDDLQPQIDSLLQIRQNKQINNKLLPNDSKLKRGRYAKKYYEPRNDDIIPLIKNYNSRILSVGCGSGETEKHLSQLGHEVIALPLDSVISTKARRQGIEIIDGGILEACRRLRSERFDYILIEDILHLTLEPTEFLRAICSAMNQETFLIIHWTNMNSIKNLYVDITQFKFVGYLSDFELTGVHFISMRKFRQWCRTANITITQILPVHSKKSHGFRRYNYNFFDRILTDEFISVAKKATQGD
jgi:2-polyprenyl-3-methyl-5-hydroxy-6-metoxy-1,4-benzoquinol methylase